MAPAFYPLQDSKTLFLENFRSFNYVAGGIKNIWEFYKAFDFRLEGYAFKPFEKIVPAENEPQLPRTDTELNNFSFAGAATLVYHSPVGPIALSFNYYDDNTNQFGLLLHIGYILHNRRSLE
jgi:NTE family protein